MHFLNLQYYNVIGSFKQPWYKYSCIIDQLWCRVPPLILVQNNTGMLVTSCYYRQFHAFALHVWCVAIIMDTCWGLRSIVVSELICLLVAMVCGACLTEKFKVFMKLKFYYLASYACYIKQWVHILVACCFETGEHNHRYARYIHLSQLDDETSNRYRHPTEVQKINETL